MKIVFYRYGNYFAKMFFITSLFLFSCKENSVQKEKKISENNDLTEKNPEIKLNNPAIFMGSTFGEFFQILHKTGNYSGMLIYTSNKTKKRFNNTELIEFFQNMQFSYPLKLKAINEQNDYQTLLYNTTIDATEKTIQFNVIVENDTCRVLFEKLDTERPFKGM